MVPNEEKKMDDQVSNAPVFGVYKWAEAEIDLDALPHEVKVYFLKKGVKHKWDNEVASNILRIREKDKKTDDVYNDEYEPMANQLRNELTAKILAGDISTTIGGPRGNAVENIAFELARKQAEAKLAPKGLWPKGDRKLKIKAEEDTVVFDGRKMTQADLTNVVFERYRDQFMADAAVEHEKRKEKAKQAKETAVATVKEVDVSIDDILAQTDA